MALQDLTPQLRTRLNRLERVVGIFVVLATVLMIAGLAYYIYQRAQAKGWGKRRLPYYTFVQSGAGLKVGEAVRLMGFPIGEITRIEAQPPDSDYDVFVAFEVMENYDGYLWEDSRARVASSDLLGNRFIEITKGTNGPATYIFHPFREFTLEQAAELPETNSFRFSGIIYDSKKENVIVRAGDRVARTHVNMLLAERSVATVRVYDAEVSGKRATGLWDFKEARYRDPNENVDTRKGYFLVPDETPALNERLELVAGQVQRMVGIVEASLPSILNLTNQLQNVLENAANTAETAADLLADAKPVVANLTQITETLREPEGTLGQWLIPSEMREQITMALTNVNTLLTHSDAQIATLAGGMDAVIDNLAMLTGNLHAQVKSNSNIVSEVSRLIVDTDEMVQGLKRHWLLRSAFKKRASTSQTRTDK